MKVFALLKENWKCENTRDGLWKDTHIAAVDDVMLFQEGIHCLIKNKPRTATWVERSTWAVGSELFLVIAAQLEGRWMWLFTEG